MSHFALMVLKSTRFDIEDIEELSINVEE